MIGLTNTLCFYVDSMIKRKTCVLVGISSLAAFRGLPQGASYSSSKAGQRIIMESFREDLKKHGISCLSIHPVFIETAMSDHGDFPTPFKLTTRQSSVHIAKAIAKNKSLYL